MVTSAEIELVFLATVILGGCYLGMRAEEAAVAKRRHERAPTGRLVDAWDRFPWQAGMVTCPACHRRWAFAAPATLEPVAFACDGCGHVGSLHRVK